MSTAPASSRLGTETQADEGALATIRRGLALTPELLRGVWITLLLAVIATAGKVVVPIAVQSILDRGIIEPERPDLPFVAAAAGLALGETQHLGQAQLQGQLVQAVLAHQMGADAGQVALVGPPETLVQQGRHRQTQHRVTEELEPLVVIGPEAAMGQGAREQPRLREAVAEALLQCVEARVHVVPVAATGAPVTSNGPRT